MKFEPEPKLGDNIEPMPILWSSKQLLTLIRMASTALSIGWRDRVDMYQEELGRAVQREKKASGLL